MENQLSYVITGKFLATHLKKIFTKIWCQDESLRRRKNDKKVKMKGGLGWIRELRGQEQDMSSLAFKWEISRYCMYVI